MTTDRSNSQIPEQKAEHSRGSRRKRKVTLVATALGVATLGATLVACGSTTATSDASQSTSQSSQTVQASSKETHIKWVNNLGTSIRFTVSNADNSYWDGNSRPDHSYPEGINNYTLESGNTYDERIEVNANSSVEPKFTVKLWDGYNYFLTTNLAYNSAGKQGGDKYWHFYSKNSSFVQEPEVLIYQDAKGAAHRVTLTTSVSGSTTTVTFDEYKKS